MTWAQVKNSGHGRGTHRRQAAFVPAHVTRVSTPQLLVGPSLIATSPEPTTVQTWGVGVGLPVSSRGARIVLMLCSLYLSFDSFDDVPHWGLGTWVALDSGTGGQDLFIVCFLSWCFVLAQRTPVLRR